MRSEVLRGQARPDGLGAVVYHGMLTGLAQLMSTTVLPIAHPPSSAGLPRVQGDRAFVSLLANMVLRAHAEAR